MKPQLAVSIEIPDLRLAFKTRAYIMQPKYDGVRCLVDQSKALARSLKPIPNRFIRHQLSSSSFNGQDGELTIGELPPYEINSQVMTYEGEPKFTWRLFDLHNMPRTRYRDRLEHLATLQLHRWAKIVPWEFVQDVDAVLEYERKVMSRPGFDGLIFRDPDGYYKFGRSTMNDGGLWRFKRMEDSEGVIIGFEEEMQNTNEQVTNELGRAKRSTKKEGMVGKGTLGTFILRDDVKGWTFGLGTGFTRKQRIEFWANRQKLKGKLVKYKFCPYGCKDGPRWPVFIAFRDKRDM